MNVFFLSIESFGSGEVEIGGSGDPDLQSDLNPAGHDIDLSLSSNSIGSGDVDPRKEDFLFLTRQLRLDDP